MICQIPSDVPNRYRADGLQRLHAIEAKVSRQGPTTWFRSLWLSRLDTALGTHVGHLSAPAPTGYGQERRR